MFTAIKNFESDIDIMNVDYNQGRIIKVSQTEKALVEEWVMKNNIEIPTGLGYKFLVRKYPDKPWITD